MSKLVVGLLGAGIILAGIPLLVLPGPGLLLILAGLGVLSLEFPWARSLIERVRQRLKSRD